MDNIGTTRRLQAFILPRNGTDASHQGLPHQLDIAATRHLRSSDWEDLRELPDNSNYGEKQVAKRFPYLRSDDR